jgi:hypothetical protein
MGGMGLTAIVPGNFVYKMLIKYCLKVGNLKP